jgi:hypothetical protein
MKLSPREQRLVSIMLIIAAACALYFLALGPALGEKSRLNEEIAQTDRKIEKARQDEQNFRTAEKDWKELMLAFGPMIERNDEAEHAGFKLREAAAAARAEQARIVTTQPLAPSAKGEKGEWTRFPTQFNLEGDLIGITNLLIRLRHVAPRIDVERVSIRANNQDPNRMTVQLIVSSYAFAKEKEKKNPVRRATTGR